MPHCGKSVLAYMLSQHLRRMDIAHYLLRAAPDGKEGWLLEMENRPIPLLVDVGGLPRDEEIGIIRACTRPILLYREPEDSTHRETILKKHSLPPADDSAPLDCQRCAEEMYPNPGQLQRQKQKMRPFPGAHRAGGDDGTRTRDQGFADPCLANLATSP